MRVPSEAQEVEDGLCGEMLAVPAAGLQRGEVTASSLPPRTAVCSDVVLKLAEVSTGGPQRFWVLSKHRRPGGLTLFPIRVCARARGKERLFLTASVEIWELGVDFKLN